MSETKSEIYVFGLFQLNSGQRCLTRDGAAIALTPKEFDTLLALVKAKGLVVSKDDLLSQVWPDSYVGDGSLMRNISVLRSALGAEVIETLPRRGYRITVDVTSVVENASSFASEHGIEPSAASAATDGAAVTARLEAAHLQDAPTYRWRKGRSFVGLALSTVLILAIAAFLFSPIRIAKARPSASPVRSVLIQKEGAIDPLDEGFKLHAPDNGQYPRAIYNRETNGWDRWRLMTDDQNYYYRPLSAEEKDFALQRDWKLTCVCALESGGGEADIDFAGKGPRFDIGLMQEGNRYFVGMTKQISPTLEFDEKIEFAGVADVAHPHTYELRYDHVTKTASLWIDGKQMASGYRGHYQFQEDRGVLFGVAIYGNVPKSSAVFREVRFEVPASASAPPIQSILIQKEGALDPLDEGFRLARPQGQYPQAIYNRETNGWDRWRIVSDDQNYYYRILSAAERDFALQRDWKLTCVCAVESGAGEADIDLAGGPRFDMEFLQEGNQYFVALVNQLSPELKWDQKIEFSGAGNIAHPHTYELRYDHVKQTASLWIDGRQTASGYRGYHQFQDDSKPSLSFGTFIYGHAPKGSFVSRRIRFEVN